MKLNHYIHIAIAVLCTTLAATARAETDDMGEELPGMGPQPASFFVARSNAAAEQKAAANARPAEQAATYFYTGKPYDEDLGAYVFAFRNYDPELNRWMTADPSGFPDGANDLRYAPVPTMGLDPFGLYDTTKIFSGIAGIGAGVITTAGGIVVATNPELTPLANAAGAAAAFLGVQSVLFSATNLIDGLKEQQTWIPQSFGGAMTYGIANTAGATEKLSQSFAGVASFLEGLFTPGELPDWISPVIRQAHEWSEKMGQTSEGISAYSELREAWNSKGDKGYE